MVPNQLRIRKLDWKDKAVDQLPQLFLSRNQPRVYIRPKCYKTNPYSLHNVRYGLDIFKVG